MSIKKVIIILIAYFVIMASVTGAGAFVATMLLDSQSVEIDKDSSVLTSNDSTIAFTPITYSLVDGVDKDLTTFSLNAYTVDGQSTRNIYIDIEEYLNAISVVKSNDTRFKLDNGVLTYFFQSYKDYPITVDFINQKLDMTQLALLDTNLVSSNVSDELVAGLRGIFSYDSRLETQAENAWIELTQYKLDLVYRDSKYYMPLSLVNLLFSGYEYKLVFNGNSFGLLNIFTDNSSLFDTSIKPFVTTGTEIAMNDADLEMSKGFYRFIFENYYGLGENPEIMNLVNNLSTTNYTKDLEALYEYLDDPHSSLQLLLQSSQIIPDGGNSPVSSDEYVSNLQCDDSRDVFAKSLGDDIGYIAIYSYNGSSFYSELKTEMANIAEDETVIVDISCNTGGYLINAIATFNGMVDSIDSYYMEINGTKYVDTYTFDQTGPFEGKKVYLVTSNQTFSAGNYAAVLFHDNNVGKIIGEASGGGTAAVGLIASYDGSFATMSNGTNILTDKNYNLVENGVPVDIPMSFTADSNAYFQNLITIVKQDK